MPVKFTAVSSIFRSKFVPDSIDVGWRGGRWAKAIAGEKPRLAVAPPRASPFTNVRRE
jgi:hypothetical protein